MFCSINHGYMNPLFEPLREFVLNKEKIGLDKAKYKLCMYLTDSRIMKYNGLSVLLNLKVAPVESMVLSEITAYPFGFILYLNPTDTWEYKGVDITTLADCDYDCKVQVDIPWKIKEVNDIYPESYRSKDEILECIENSRDWHKEHNER